MQGVRLPYEQRQSSEALWVSFPVSVRFLYNATHQGRAVPHLLSCLYVSGGFETNEKLPATSPTRRQVTCGDTRTNVACGPFSHPSDAPFSAGGVDVEHKHVQIDTHRAPCSQPAASTSIRPLKNLRFSDQISLSSIYSRSSFGGATASAPSLS